jgi:tRNA (mo5U34)-methyltransferase
MLRLRTPAPPVRADVAGGPFVLDDAQLSSLGFTRQSLAEVLSSREWFHWFDFGDGLVATGRDPSARKLAALELPDLAGRTVLDIGTFDGYFAFESERRGAARVVANDHWVWIWPGGHARGNFELVHALLDSRVEMLEAPVEVLDGNAQGTFDVTLFLGVLYHAPDMLGYLRRVRSVTSGMLVLETLVDALDVDRPTAVFYPPGSIPGDDSNHWGPNPACVEAMLRRAGFSRVERKSLWFANALGEPGRRRSSRRPTNGRMVFHAW